MSGENEAGNLPNTSARRQIETRTRSIPLLTPNSGGIRGELWERHSHEVGAGAGVALLTPPTPPAGFEPATTALHRAK